MITDFYLEPVSGEFDVIAVEAYAEAMPFTVRDMKPPATFMVAQDEETLEEAIAERKLDDHRFPSPVLLINVHASRIDISYLLSPIETARTFVKWLRQHYEIRLRDEEFNDVTAQLDANLDLIFGPQPPKVERNARDPASRATLDRGRYELEESICGGPDRAQYRAHDHQESRSVLVTLGPPQRDDHELVRRRLAFAVPGIAKLLHIGPLSTSEPRCDGLVEEEPPGERASLRTDPWSVARTVALGLAVGDVVLAVHSRGESVGGLRPELVYLAADALFAIAPRCEPFLAVTEKRSYGVPPCFAEFYVSPEQLARGGASTPADDAFAVAAMLAKLHTGEHPFVGEYGENAMSIATRRRRRWNGDSTLEAMLEPALVPGPKRISLGELCGLLREIAT